MKDSPSSLPLSRVLHLPGQELLEERPKPQGVASDDDGAPVLLEDPIGELQHPLEPIALLRLVPGALGDVQLRRVHPLEVRRIRHLVREGHRQGLVGGRDAHRVRVDGDLLQRRQDGDLLVGIPLESLLERNDNRAHSASQVAADQRAPAGLSEQKRNHCILPRSRGGLGQEGRQLLRLVMAKAVEGRVEKPRVKLAGHEEIELHEEGFHEAGKEAKCKFQRATVFSWERGQRLP
eukprot:scaffold5222_cov293-Pinguiococcus_pyrenoidosus.AAC.2